MRTFVSSSSPMKDFWEKKRFIVNLCLSSSAQILVEVYNFWCMKAPTKRLISIYVKKKKWKWNIWQCLMGETLLTSSKVKIRLTRKKNSIPRSGCSALHGVNPNFKKRSIKTEKNKKVPCLYFDNTSFILRDFFETKYTSSTLLSLKRNAFFRKSTSNILLSLHINT